jgi:fructokinase
MNNIKEIDMICLGEVLIDMFPAEVGRSLTEVSSFRPVPGGAPANVAVAGAHLGLQTAFIGKVGDDTFGRHLAAVLKNHHVDTQGMRFDKTARTGLAFIALPDVNNYEILFYRNPGADMRLEASELDFKLLQNTKSLHFGSLSLAQEPSSTATMQAIEFVKKAGGLISFDVNYRPSLWESPHQFRECITPAISKAHVLKINEIELEVLTGATEANMGSACKDLLKKGPELVVVTLGPEGCYIRNQNGDVRLKGFSVSAIDATGCGDAFIAGLLSKLVAEEKHCDSLAIDDLKLFGRYANAVGALTAQSKGVMPALPFKEQVDAFMQKSTEKQQRKI